MELEKTFLPRREGIFIEIFWYVSEKEEKKILAGFLEPFLSMNSRITHPYH